MTFDARAGDAVNELAIAESGTTKIHVYDGKGGSEPLKTLENIHMKPIRNVKTNN